MAGIAEYRSRFLRGSCGAAVGLFLILLLALTGCAGGRTAQGKGIYHTVRTGETLTRIASAYATTPQHLARVNGIKPSASLGEGQVLFIPQAERAIDTTKATPGAATKPPSPVAASDSGKPYSGKTAAASTKPSRTPVSEPLWRKAEKSGTTPAPAATPPRKASPRAAPGDDDRTGVVKGRFAWPVRGKVAGRFGAQPGGMLHNHIIIAAREGASVSASAAGTVIFSANLKEFGETVIIKHDGRYATVYTHLGARSVKTDRKVRRGDTIGTVGRGERAGQGEIHFEIRYNNKARNPLLFLN